MTRSPLAVPFAVLALTLAAVAAHAQGFHAVATKDGIDVWAVGDSGRVYRSLNSGATLPNLERHMLALDVSPGGAADLLAATLFLDRVEAQAIC